MPMIQRRGMRVSAFGLLLGVLAWGLPARAPAQDAGPAADKRDEEMRYVDALNRFGLNAYAELVLSKLGEGPEVKVRRLQSALGRGEFDKVKGIIDAEPDQQGLATWMMRRSLADAYFAWGKYPEARAGYDAIFAKFTGPVPEEFKQFYLDSAYTYAQMQLLMNDPSGAIAAYRKGIAANPPRDVKRQFQGGLVDLLIKQAEATTGSEQAGYLNEAEKITQELLWIQDLWFGRAIVAMAHVMMLKGDLDGAMKLVDDYRDALKTLDDTLKSQSTMEEDLTRLSPMAEARYLIGSILLDEAKKALAAGNKAKALELLAGKEEVRTGQAARKLPGALQHFLNVFVKYPNTQWAGDAGAKYEEVVEILDKQLGKKVEARIRPEEWARVEAEQIGSARTLLNQQKYAEAADQYLALLRRSPEGPNALDALASLGTCYVELKDDLYADMVIHYIAERFNKKPGVSARAGDIVLGFGNMYAGLKQPERKDAIYEVYFNNFKTHVLAAQLLSSAGDRRLATNDFTGAIKYYVRVARDHASSPASYVALSKMALCYEKLGDTTNQLRMLETYITRSTNENRTAHELIRVMYRQATAYRLLGTASYPKAVQRYNEIEQRLTTKREAYQANSEEAAQNQELLEMTMYYKATCFARVKPPQGQPENAYKERAIGIYQKLADSYPKSKLASTALSQLGTLWTVLGNAAEAQKALSRLKTDYPDSVEAKNVDFMLANNLLKLGKRAEAVPLFKQMFSSGGTYSDGQILAAGNELFKAREYEIAVEAFDRVLANAAADNRGLVEPALANKGIALVELKRYADGVAALDKLFETYPKSPYTVAGAKAITKACAELGATEADADKRIDLFNKAVKSLKTVMQHNKAPGSQGAATIQIGTIYELKAKAEAEFGSAEKAKEFRKEAIANYQTLTLFADPADAALRPYLEEAYWRQLAQAVQVELWQDVFDDSTTYLKLFPEGPHALDVRQWRSRANAQLQAAGVAQPAQPTEAAPPNG